jgi:hypothetical protein
MRTYAELQKLTITEINKEYASMFRKIKVIKERKRYLSMQTDDFLKWELQSVNDIRKAGQYTEANGQVVKLNEERKEAFNHEWLFLSLLIQKRQEVAYIENRALESFKKLNNWEEFLTNYKG